MYTRFFGLNEKPFAITPDPRYLFMSERHGEGLAHLIYGVTESGGFIQLTGEVGTGKTTLVRTLLGQLPAEVDVALILNPQLSALEFLLAICEELKVALPDDKTSAKALVDALNGHLLDAHASGRRTILLVDEAQNLSEDVLEQVRLLTNLETARQKLLQIILIGQPELRDLLAQNNLRQLAQRVTGRYHLEPLNRDEALAYIDHRMKVAGALTDVFEPAAKRRIFRLSGGIPRIMNVLCDRALLGAYSAETRTVTPAIVRRAAAEVAGAGAGGHRWLLPASAVLVTTAVIAAALWALRDPVVTVDEAVVSLPLAASPMPIVSEEPETAVTIDAESSEPPDTAAESLPSLETLLGRHGSDVNTAMTALFERWNVRFESGSGTGCEQAEQHGLRCLFQRGSWNTVEQLNRPSMLTLTDNSGRNHYPVLMAIDNEHAELVVGSEAIRVPVSEVRDLWFGQYMLLWRPPNGSVAALGPGSRGANVVWLRRSLAQLGAEFSDTTDETYFDAELEQRLREFQRQHRLQVDGLAGQQTQILINSLLPEDNTPLLAQVSQ